MPLTIDFKSGDRLIVNGAVIENIGSNAKILVHNQAMILRGREVISEEDSKTPASRIYFALQCAYIFPERQNDYVELFEKLLDEYVTACPSAQPIADELLAITEKENFYKALKVAFKLIRHESEVLNEIQGEFDQAASS